MTERGGGLADAFRSGGRRGSSGGEGGAVRGEAVRAARGSVRRRNRKKVGKRSDPRYGQAPAYVLKSVFERTKEAMANREIRVELEEDLRERGVEFKEGKPDFGALVEMLLLDWLEEATDEAGGR